MKDESKIWLSYAKENLLAAQFLSTQSLYNPCLQNVQQSIEKGLKALLLEKGCSPRKTSFNYRFGSSVVQLWGTNTT